MTAPLSSTREKNGMDEITEDEFKRMMDAHGGLWKSDIRVSVKALREIGWEVRRSPSPDVAVVEALSQCAIWFQEYADSHTAQGKLDKAKRNQDRADFARAALSSRPAMAVPDGWK